MSAPAKTSGFTLIEVLLAMLIFMAGVTGVYSLLSMALGMQRQGMETSRGTRELAAIVWQLQQEVSAGQHWDDGLGRWQDLEAVTRGDGLVYSCHFVAEVGNERLGSLVASIAVAASEAGLATAEPVSYLLSPGPTAAAAVREVRQRKTRP